MWNKIKDFKDVKDFLEKVDFFHDSCIKELKYLSGAYVDEDLSMYPLNEQRVLNIIMQRQSENMPMIEMEFRGLKYLKLFPTDDRYTCEILDSTMILKGGYIYWCDCGGVSETNLDGYNGTMICAMELRWRAIDKCMGKKEFFVSIE